MKKIFIALFLMVLGSAAFSMEMKPLILGVSGEPSFAFEHTKFNGEDVKSTMSSIGVNVLLGSLLNDKWGLFDTFSFSWPQKLTLTSDGETVSVSRDAYKTLMFMNFTIAVDYFFINNEKFMLGVGPALNMAIITASTKRVSDLSYIFGLGAQLLGRYKFTERFGLHFGMNLNYDFFGINIVKTSYTSKTNSGIVTDFIVSPFAGISFKI